MTIPAHAVQLIDPLSVLPGTGHGFRQALCLGLIRVIPPGEAALALVQSRLAALFGHPALRPPWPGAPALTLVETLLACVLVVQQQARLPVFEAGKVLGQRTEADGALVLHFAMPLGRVQPALIALQGVLAIVDKLMAMPAAAADPDGAAPLDPADSAASRAGTDGAEHFSADLAQLQVRLKPYHVPGNNTLRFMHAARQMDMPFQAVVDNIFSFGQGRNARWLDSSFSDKTSVLSVQVVRQKHLAAQVLRDNGFPVPDHQLVADADAAVRVADAMGYPVVVKPADLDGGTGVTADVRSADAVRTAYAQARPHSSRILVERHAPGVDYRLTIAHGQLVKAVQRLPGGVLGDGLNNVADLIDLANAQPRRARRNQGRGAVLLTLDDEARGMLAERGWSPAQVPAEGEFVALRRRANVSTGGEAVLVTHRVHADNRRLAERAAQTLRLDLAGVDLIMADISKSWLDIGAAICEVNAQPQIGDGTTPQVYVDLLRGMVARDGRIPIVLIIDSRPQTGAAALGRELQAHFERHGLPCVLASSAGVWLAEPQAVCQPRDFFKSALAAIALPTAGAAVLVASISELRRHGLPFDRCEAVVLAHWGSASGPDEAGLEPLLRLLLPHIRHGLVMDAGDTLALALATRLAPQRLNVIQATLSDVVATADRAWQTAMPIDPPAPVPASGSRSVSGSASVPADVAPP